MFTIPTSAVPSAGSGGNAEPCLATHLPLGKRSMDLLASPSWSGAPCLQDSGPAFPSLKAPTPVWTQPQGPSPSSHGALAVPVMRTSDPVPNSQMIIFSVLIKTWSLIVLGQKGENVF